MSILPAESFAGVTLYCGDCRDVLPTLPENSVDAVVTDPPYGFSFMGKEWDHGVPGITFWQAALRVLKPSGYMLCFGGTRTYHRLACAVEDAGFEIRDCLMWVYGSGFPKGQGNLKPAWEPILLCRKPGKGVLPLGIDECRVPTSDKYSYDPAHNGTTFHGQQGNRIPYSAEKSTRERLESHPSGRYPANLVHDGSQEVLEAFAAFGEKKSCNSPSDAKCASKFRPKQGAYQPQGPIYPGDTGTAARFFYCAKASRKERGAGNLHPTVKPLSLMDWLVKLICPVGGKVLDPFLGSGTTALACHAIGRDCIGIDNNPDYLAIAMKRLKAFLHPTPRTNGKKKPNQETIDPGPVQKSIFDIPDAS